MAKSETPRGVEATGFADNKLIENCPLVITTIECRPKDKKTYEFDYKIAGNPQDKDALFLKDIRESTKKEESSGFFSCGGSTYKVYEGTKVESDDLGKVIGEVAKQTSARWDCQSRSLIKCLIRRSKRHRTLLPARDLWPA